IAEARRKTCSPSAREGRYGSMRFAHLTARERPLAVVEGDRVAALAMDGLATVDDLIAAGPHAWDAARDAGTAALDSDADPLQRGMLDAPLRAPSKVACVGLNYHDHCRETGMATPERPLIFAKFASSLTGPDAPIEWPEGLTEQVDWEVELGVVIGRRIRHASEREVLDAIFGYTAANDVSARDLQFADQQWVRAKSIDSFCASRAHDRHARRIRRPAGQAAGRACERRDDAGLDHGRDDLPGHRDRELPVARLHDRTRRPHSHRHALGRGRLPRPARLSQARRHRRSRGGGRR